MPEINRYQPSNIFPPQNQEPLDAGYGQQLKREIAKLHQDNNQCWQQILASMNLVFWASTALIFWSVGCSSYKLVNKSLYDRNVEPVNTFWCHSKEVSVVYPVVVLSGVAGFINIASRSIRIISNDKKISELKQELIKTNR